jgi:HK97 family phage portal protein
MARKPGIRQRAALALQVFRGGLPPRALAEAKSLPLMWPAWRTGQPTWNLTDYHAYATEGFAGNALIYSAIRYKYNAVSKAILRAYQGDPDNPEALPPEHPLSQLCARPNRFQSGVEFMQQAEAYLNIAGENFTYMDRRDGQVVEMINLRPDRMLILPTDDQKRLLGFVYVPEGKAPRDGVPFLPDVISHTKFPNPLDPLEGLGHGLSPMSAMAASGDVDNEVTSYLKEFFERGTMAPGLVSLKDMVSDTTIAQLRDQWTEVYGGSQNWDKPIVLGGGASWQRLTLGFNEMGFEGLDERNEARVIGPFGVPLILLNTRLGLMRSTYSNAQEARRAFWEDTMTVELSLFEADLQYHLSDEASGVFPKFDLSDVPALQRNVPELVGAAYQMWQMGMPAFQAYQTAGVDTERFDGDDVSYVAINMQPAQFAQEPPQPVPPQLQQPAGNAPDNNVQPAGDGRDEGVSAAATTDTRAPDKTPAKQAEHKAGRFTEEQKTAHYKAMDKGVRAWEPRLKAAARNVFETQMRRVLAIVGKHKSKAYKDGGTIAWATVIEDVLAMLLAQGKEDWREGLWPILMGVMENRGEYWGTQLGLAFDVRNIEAQQFIADYKLAFADPISRTSADQISGLIYQAMDDGWTVDETSRHLTTMFDQWMDGTTSQDDWTFARDRMPAYRAELIARTETVRAANAGSQAVFTEWGVQYKQWLSQLDGRVRDSHRALNGQIQPINKAFVSGDGNELMYPGDPNAPIGEFANCRCTTLPIVGDLTDEERLQMEMQELSYV